MVKHMTPPDRQCHLFNTLQAPESNHVIAFTTRTNNFPPSLEDAGGNIIPSPYLSGRINFLHCQIGFH
jgi:hypothetical protein